MKNKKNSFKSKIALFLSSLFILQFVMINTNNVNATVNTSISYTVSGDTKVGSTIEIAVHASNVKDLYGGSIDFLYDPSILQVESITKGDIFGSKTVLTPLGENGQVGNGQASFAVTLKGNTSGIIETNGTIAIIKAKVLKAGTVNLNTISDNSNLNLNGNTVRVKLSNANANSISYTATSESISLTEDVVSSTVALNAGTYQENNSALVYSGAWNSRSSDNYDGGSLKLGTAKDSFVEFKFNGTSFEWYGTKAFNRGIAKVYVDNVEVDSVDAYSSSTSFTQRLYKSDNLDSGEHTVKIVVSGNKNKNSSDIQIDIDKIIITNEANESPVDNILSVGAYQEYNSAFVYSGTWNSRSSDNYDGGSLKLGTAKDSFVEFKFNGTSFEWYGTKAFNRGIAKVYVDNVEVDSVDAYSSSTSFTQRLYKSDNLDSGEHTVKIVVSGNKNKNSSDIQIDIDKIIIN